MRAFTREVGVVMPLDRADVDTDQIIPKQFLKRVERRGYGAFLFNDWRFDSDGGERADFVLNAPAYRGAGILVAGRNFGCGSSREHAVWALTDFGIRAVIAPSFADIFRGNAQRSGLLCVQLDDAAVRVLLDLVLAQPGVTAEVDLAQQTVTCGAQQWHFEIDPGERRALLDGTDEITTTLMHADAIAAFESGRPAWMPDLSRVEPPVSPSVRAVPVRGA